MRSGFRLTRMFHRPPNAQAHDPQQRSDLEDGKDVLDPRSRAHTEHVDDTQNQQRQDRNQLLGGNRQSYRVAEDAPTSQVDEDILRRHPRNQDTEEFPESHGHGGNRSRLDDEEQRPAVEESEQRPESFAQVNVLAARARHHGGKLSVGYSGHHGHEAAHRPGEEEQFGRLNLAGHIG